MMQRLATFSVDDIAFDPKAVGNSLNERCNEGRNKYYVRGACQTEGVVHFVLLPRPEHREEETYVLAPLSEDVTPEGVEAELAERWSAGFDTIATINLGRARYYALFARVSR